MVSILCIHNDFRPSLDVILCVHSTDETHDAPLGHENNLFILLMGFIIIDN